MASLSDDGHAAGDDPYTRTYRPSNKLSSLHSQRSVFPGSVFSPAPTYDSGPSSPIFEKPSSVNDSQDSLRDSPNGHVAHEKQSQTAQRAALLEWKRQVGSNAFPSSHWPCNPSSPSTATCNGGGLYRRITHARNFSEQFLSLGEKITAPVRRTLAAVASGDSGRSSVVAPSDQPQSSLTAPLQPRRYRWILLGLCTLVILSFVSALLPYSSPLSLWRLLGDDPWVEYSTLTDDRNQRLAAGKGWGWAVKAEWKTGDAKSDVSDLDKAQHDYMYSSAESPAEIVAADADSTDVDAHPDIPCHLDVAAFGAQYNLTPSYTFSRRYVTAKHTPPSFDRPDGFDPHPRELDQPLVQGWQQMHWSGWAGVGDDACAEFKGKRRNLCYLRLGQADPLATTQPAKGPGQKEKRVNDATQRLTPRSSLTPLDSCSSSQTPLQLPTYPLPRTRTRPHNLILGLASDVERITRFLPQLEYSFAWSNLHLVLNLPPHPKAKALKATLQTRGIRATIIQSPEEDYLRRWVELPSLLYDFAEPGVTQWAMVADDDTFWMSISKILVMLDKYDPDRPRYIGALTDDWRQSNSGPIAFGGAGLILSMSLLEELQPHWTDCKRLTGPGDHRLAECIYAHSHTRLTLEWSLMQTDLHDDIRGLLESGRDMATMHHWTSWHTGFDPLLVSRAGVVCGSECLLQRFLAPGNHNASAAAEDNNNVFLLVHGLSLTLYPSPHPDFGKTELTWKVFGNSQFAHAIGPTRQRVREGRPLGHRRDATHPESSKNWRETWTLEDVRLDSDADGLPFSWDGDGRGAREIYIKRGARAKGYDLGKETAPSEEEAAALLSDANADSQNRASAVGFAAKLFGSRGSSAAKEKNIVTDASEDDSVIELVWV